MEAARVSLCGALDAGHRPAVLSAAMKVATTELARDTVADGMDVVGGAALCRGPRNPLAGGLGAAAVGITVEGANILTRSLIVFGQGALRCHPWVRRETAAFEIAGRESAAAGGRALARAVAGHLGSLVRNLARAALLDASRGRLARAPRAPGVRSAAATAGWWRRLGWAAVRFAVLADLAILGLGPALKRREALAGRFADALGWWFLGVAALRRFDAEGRRPEDLPLAGWAAEQALGEIQAAAEGIARNFGGAEPGGSGGAPRWLAWLLRGPGLAWLRLTPLGAGPTSIRRCPRRPSPLARSAATRRRWTAGLLPTHQRPTRQRRRLWSRY
jgi:acyl-CoA dehydrogenase